MSHNATIGPKNLFSILKMWVNITACRLFWAPEARSSHSVILQDRVGTLCRLYDSATMKIPSSGGTPYEQGCFELQRSMSPIYSSSGTQYKYPECYPTLLLC